ncbi:Inner membrane protein YrbG [Defluviimonas aquaemixtae]|uniref:Inner membrane protein YrbG n=1 Tax=Albidovulum aquaemixtae TaxID=1542388 RepID=A0A2R8B728_9RHOB|nr:calcium/sodium antiporter [Defluviimonas aquaemixtae]SPH18394.1 Inner membrane protein YrbG [Defluviimonas aquaemixtae]
MTDIWLPLFGGFLFLIFGGELLVRGAVRVAERLGVSPLVIGLTLVGFGTSTPELVTSVRAALAGSPGIAYGNIVGSNIANILLIVGISALLTPMAVTSGALKRDGGVMLAVALVFAVLAAAFPITRGVGLAFVLGLALYIFYAFRTETASAAAEHGAVYEKAMALEGVDPAIMPLDKTKPNLWLSLATALAGLVLVIVGGGFLVDGAVALARSKEISETVIGLTIVAVGTSMPELVTSVVAAIRRQSDVAFGNIIGSNIYNILGIGGVTALIAPTDVPQQIIRFDIPVMILGSLALIAVAHTGLKISRREGSGLLVGYVAYLWWLWPT